MTASIELCGEVARLYALYAASLDGERYDDWLDLFAEECSYKLVPRENFDRGHPLATLWFESKAMLRDRIYGITETLFHAPYYQRHVIGPALVAIDGDEVCAEANYLVVRTKRDQPSEMFNAGRYVDRIVRTAGGLKFREKLCVFDSELIPNSIIYPI